MTPLSKVKVKPANVQPCASKCPPRASAFSFQYLFCDQFLDSNVKSKVKLLFSPLHFISSDVKPNFLFGIIYISPGYY
jgi:hypothetical protein